jgi:hypothetical protein
VSYDETKKGFFDLAIGDILRALDGQSIVGSITLSLSAIDYLAYFFFKETEKKRKQDRSDYQDVVRFYMNSNNKYSPEWNIRVKMRSCPYLRKSGSI